MFSKPHTARKPHQQENLPLLNNSTHLPILCAILGLTFGSHICFIHFTAVRSLSAHSWTHTQTAVEALIIVVLEAEKPMLFLALMFLNHIATASYNREHGLLAWTFTSLPYHFISAISNT